MNISIPSLIAAAIAYDRGDARRIHHFLKVYTSAHTIGVLEGLAPDALYTLDCAAVLHDIGIHAAEEKHGSNSGKFQEMEGPAIAKTILESLGCEQDVLDRVCFLIGHHHTYDAIDGLDYQILIEADFLVNAYEDGLDKKAVATFRDKLFKTPGGSALLNDTYGLL